MSAKNKESANKSIRRKSDRKMKFISWYYKLTESAILNYLKMPSTPYDLVRDDQDLRIPLHAEQAFFNGISFPAKVSSMRGSKPFRFYFLLFFLFFVAAPFDFQMLELPWFFFHLRRRSFWCYGINWILYLVLRGSIADNARRISAILSTATYVFDCFRWKQFPMLLSLSAPQVFILTLTNWIIYDVNGCYFWGGRGWNRLEFCWIGRKSIASTNTFIEWKIQRRIPIIHSIREGSIEVTLIIANRRDVCG